MFKSRILHKMKIHDHGLSPLLMAFYELLGDCIWSCFPDGQYAY